MTLSEQSAILLEAIEADLLQPEDIVRWTDSLIVAMDKPPTWIIELTTLNSPYLVDFASRLRDQLTAPLPMRRQIQLVVLAHDSGLIALSGTLQKLFRLTIFDSLEQGAKARDALEERLNKLLVEWDCQENLEVIQPQLEVKLEALFREFLNDAEEIRSLLPWKFKKAV
jgi:hypothetical protein